MSDVMAQMALITTLITRGPTPDFTVHSWDGRELVVLSEARRTIGAEGAALMALEDYLRKWLGQPVEVYLQTRRDDNKPRSPEQRARIHAWVTARAGLKAQGEMKA